MTTDSSAALDARLADMYARVFTEQCMSGFQATEVLRGIQIMSDTIALRRRHPQRHRVVLAYTSNMISSGLRECIAGLIAAGVVDAVVTTAGGIEEDLIKCLGPTLIGDFALDGSALRDKGLNRIGNLLVPNNNYVLFEAFFRRVLHGHRVAQRRRGCAPDTTAPCDFLRVAGEHLELIEAVAAQRRERKEREDSASNSSKASGGGAGAMLGVKRKDNDDEVDDEDDDDDGFAEALVDIDLDELRRQRKQSVAYQAWKHGVPILCPAFTDGSMGDMTFFFNISHPGMVVDSGRDALVLEEEVLRAPGVESAAVIAVGGGLPKHFALRACRGLLRDAVLITTTPPCVDGSVSSGTPEDEISQELLPAAGAGAANVVHVRVEATLCFPFMCAMALFSE